MMRYRIGELVEIIDGDRGANYPKQDEFFDKGYCLFLNTGNVTKNGFSFSSNQFITQEKDSKLRKGKLARNDIVYTTRGTVGNAAFYSPAVEFENVRINSGMIIIRKKDEAIDQNYLYQALKSDTYRNIFLQYCSGSAQPQLPIKTFSKIKIDIPDITTQEKIADILSTYDELIENNNKRIAILKQMAESLYKEWFVRFRFPGHENIEFENGMPKDWEYMQVEHLTDVLQRGISPVYDDNGELCVISQKCVRKSIMDINEARRQTKPFKAELNLQDGDTVICSTGTGTLGRVGQVYGDYPNTTFDSHVTLVRAKHGVGKHFLFYSLKKLQPWFMSMGIGSTNQQELYRKTIKNAKMLVPSAELIDVFENHVEPIHQEIINITKTNTNLTKQRDLLLPRLMSGKLEV